MYAPCWSTLFASAWMSSLTLGWNSMDVTKFKCWNTHRQSFCDVCHNLSTRRKCQWHMPSRLMHIHTAPCDPLSSIAKSCSAAGHLAQALQKQIDTHLWPCKIQNIRLVSDVFHVRLLLQHADREFRDVLWILRSQQCPQINDTVLSSWCQIPPVFAKFECPNRAVRMIRAWLCWWIRWHAVMVVIFMLVIVGKHVGFVGRLDALSQHESCKLLIVLFVLCLCLCIAIVNAPVAVCTPVSGFTLTYFPPWYWLLNELGRPGMDVGVETLMCGALPSSEEEQEDSSSSSSSSSLRSMMSICSSSSDICGWSCSKLDSGFGWRRCFFFRPIRSKKLRLGDFLIPTEDGY